MHPANAIRNRRIAAGKVFVRAGRHAPAAASAIFATTALLGLAMLIPSSASADTAPPARRVSYADLDLSKPEDVATLNLRLNAAAEKVCRPESQSVALRLRRIGERCMEDAIARAVQQLDRIELTANVESVRGVLSRGLNQR